jgi:polyisoprenoid-binding protein YceI
VAAALIPRLALACCALACCATAAAAGAWRGDPGSGSLQFMAVQAGATFAGAFRRFAVEFDFDPARPAAGRLDVTVETASVDTADAERDEILRGRDFFWVERHPRAVFHAARFERDGSGWRAQGELTLRGVARPVAVRFELAADGDRLLMTGTSQLRRLEFGVGQGEWESTEWVGDAVGLRFELRLRPAAPGP